ncbi:MAG: DUF86 domain-containing protein [Chloroflexi bacterium]|nr:DUF86 domain-containing protein [Chloroflexota bacterium]
MRDDMVLMLDMLLAAQNIQQFVAGMTEQEFYEHRMAQSAVIRELQVIGEAARLVSEDARTRYPSIEWRQIAGMRNRIIHDYFDIRLKVVWDAIQDDILVLVAQLVAIVPPDDEADEDSDAP